MTLRLSESIRSIARATEPREVLDALQKQAGPLNVMAIGTLDNHSNAFFHGSVPVKYRRLSRVPPAEGCSRRREHIGARTRRGLAPSACTPPLLRAPSRVALAAK